MSTKKLQAPGVLLLGMLLGLGIASYRAFLPGEFARAGEKKEAAGGIFSPPGTSDSGTVVPPPNPGRPRASGGPGHDGAGRVHQLAPPGWPHRSYWRHGRDREAAD